MKTTFALCALLLAATTVLANRAPVPVPREKPAPEFVLQIDENAREATLYVPRALARGEAPGTPRRGAWLDSAPTVVVALCLTLAFASGGVWLMRKGQPGVRRTLLGILLAVVLLGAGSATLWADLVPFPRPGQPRPLDVTRYPGYVTNMPVKVTIVDTNESVIRLVINPELQKKLGNKPVKATPKK